MLCQEGLPDCQESFTKPSFALDSQDRDPDNRQATVLRGEDIDLISALLHIAEEIFNGIGGLNVSMHRLRKRIKRQEVFFVLSQASHRFGIALPPFLLQVKKSMPQLLLTVRVNVDAVQRF